MWENRNIESIEIFGALTQSYYQMSVSPYYESGDFVGLLCIATNITRRKQSELEIQQKSEELERTNSTLRRFNEAAVGREERMIALKKEVNELLEELGREQEYKLDFLGKDK